MIIISDLVIENVIKTAKRRNYSIDEILIRKAYEFAYRKHKNQKRKSGEPYIIHPLNVAQIVAEMGLDTATICAALLHDVVEDTNATYEVISKKFGAEIADIVEGVTKLTNSFATNEERQTENYKKLFIAMDKDIRVILLKIADRLHNVTTLEYLDRKKQISIAKETLEIYAPIANKLGMYDMKCRLEDEAFKYLYPDEYIDLLNKIEKKKREKMPQLEKIILNIHAILRRNRISSIVNIEIKNVYNVYKKMQKYDGNIDEIKDLFVLKIILRNRKNCYISTGLINNNYQVIPGTFKDYIASPRDNMYEALQSILINDDGTVFEVHICSCDMHKVSKYGILAFFSYVNENKLFSDNLFVKDKFLGIKNSIELEKEINNPKIFLNTLKTELYEDEVYVFSEKGELIILPKGATVLDFIFKIKESIEDKFIASKVNYMEMPVIAELKDGDIVEIYESDKELIAEKNWLNLVKTAKAKSEILKMINQDEECNHKDKNINIEIYAKDRKNLVLDIINKLKEKDINILSLKTEYVDEINVKICIIVEKFKKEVLEKVLEEFEKSLGLFDLNTKKCDKKLVRYKN